MSVTTLAKTVVDVASTKSFALAVTMTDAALRRTEHPVDGLPRSFVTKNDLLAELNDIHLRCGSVKALRVIDFQGLLKSAWIMRGARGADGNGRGGHHGYTWSSAREPLSTLVLDAHHPVPWGQHAIVRNRQLAAAALCYTPDEAVRYGIGSDQASSAARPTLVVLHSTSRADKAWPEQHWRVIVQRLASRGFDVVLPWGSADEHARSMRLAESLSVTVPPKMDMNELARLFTSASLVVGVDTGLVHLAVASGAPTIAIFGPTDPKLTGVVAERAAAVNLGGSGSVPGIAQVDEAITSMLARPS